MKYQLIILLRLIAEQVTPLTISSYAKGQRVNCTIFPRSNSGLKDAGENAYPTIYALSGQPLQKWQRGVNIIKGKKIYIK